MSGTISAERLIAACAEDSQECGVRITSRLEPVGGPDAPVKPAIYSGGRYQIDKRWRGSGEDRRAVEAVVIDNVPSQANRLEAALDRLAPDVGIPRFVLDLSGVGDLPPHLPHELSSFRFPHRQADAYLRDSMFDGEPFGKTEIGSALMRGTGDAPEALLEWAPQALLFGFWQSHLGKGAGASQAKLARSWTSEIVGYEPATTETLQYGLKGDPLNLSLQTDKVENDPLDESIWAPTDGKRTPGMEQSKLSEIGHGQVPIGEGGTQRPGPAGISMRSIEQRSSVSFAGLRRVRFRDDQGATGRALLVALGLLAHVAAFGGSFSLRSGCDLRRLARDTAWEWLGYETDESVDPLSLEDAKSVFAECVAAAESAGLPVGSRWAKDPTILSPSEQLAKVIRTSYPADA